MDDYRHCHHCGRRLRNAHFCRSCPVVFCSIECLDRHQAGRHGSRYGPSARAKGIQAKTSAAARLP